jgi:ribokinase
LERIVKLVKLVVVGSFVVGLTLRVPRMPYPGESLVGDSFDFGPGGKGTNQAVAAARLGADVTLLACIGNDLFGNVALELYAKEGLSSDHIHRVAGINTGVGFVTLLSTGENTIVLDPGANMHLTPAHVDAAEPFIAGSDVVLCQLEMPDETVARAMALGRAHGATTILNPGPGRRLPEAIFADVDLLTPNETECRILLDLLPDDPTPTLELAQRLRDKGVERVVVTLGAEGALVVDATGAETIPTIPVQVVDPTGAGDAFNAALAVSLGAGMDLRAAIQEACYAGAFAVTRLGAISGLATQSDLQSFRRLERAP